MRQILIDWETYFGELGFADAWGKRIEWSSAPGEEEDQRDYIKGFAASEAGQEILLNQWNKLRENLFLQIPHMTNF